jgi:hypothetical protein
LLNSGNLPLVILICRVGFSINSSKKSHEILTPNWHFYILSYFFQHCAQWFDLFNLFFNIPFLIIIWYIIKRK